MGEVVPRAELLHALGRLVRGLSALFWGLPLALVLCVRTATADLLRVPPAAAGNVLASMFYALAPLLLTMALLLYGLLQMRHFQPQERVWRAALERAQLLAICNLGLCPFLFFWNRAPDIGFYKAGSGLMALSALLFLFNLNHALRRLAAMLPDETLRSETRFFSSMNLWLLCALVIQVGMYIGLSQVTALPQPVVHALGLIEQFRYQIVIIFGLLPLAMTMTLLWKTKEVVFASVFGGNFPLAKA